jgi:hypothetical protein
MITRWTALIVIIASLTFASFGFAQELPEDLPPPRESEHVDEHATARREIPPPTDKDPHPVLPRDATWAGILVIVILGGFFLPAAVIGPIALALAPEDEPVTSSHDEPLDGHDAHHGHGH